MGRGNNKMLLKTALSIADAASWSCALALVTIILMCSLGNHKLDQTEEEDTKILLKGASLIGQRPCDEIYVVSEGETLHSISDKCDDPFIVERNPHIHDPDDVFPGLVIMITPSPANLRSTRK